MSYRIDEYKWGDPYLGTPSGTIYWSASLGIGLSYDGALYEIDDYYTALAAAFQAWEDVAGIDFELAGEGETADVTVSMESLEGSTVGRAWISFYQTAGFDEIVSGAVALDSDEYWSPYGETDLSFYAVALHEIGHVLGLEHVEDTSEIMNPVVNALDLGEGDIEGAQILYGLPLVSPEADPDPEPTPEPEPIPEPEPEPVPEPEPAPEDDPILWLTSLFADSGSDLSARVAEMDAEEASAYFLDSDKSGGDLLTSDASLQFVEFETEIDHFDFLI